MHKNTIAQAPLRANPFVASPRKKLTFADLTGWKRKLPDGSLKPPAPRREPEPKAVPAPPPPTAKPARKPLDPAVLAAIGRLREHWPAAFNDQRRPLAIGIDKTIFAEPAFGTLRVWLCHGAYLSALARGGQRIGLDGNGAGEISEADRKGAAGFIAFRKAQNPPVAAP